MNRTTLIRVGILTTLAGIIAVAAQYREVLDAETLSATLDSFGIWAPVVFIALFALATVAFLPGMVFALAGGVIFGPVLGSIYNLTGATIGAVLAFMAARYVASGWVRERTGPRLDRIIRGVEDEGWRFVAFTRLVPLFPFNLLNYALGLTKVSFADYATASFGMIPGTLLYVYSGKIAGDVATLAGGGGVERGAGYWAVLALGMAATVAVTVVVTRTARRALDRATGV